MIRALSLALLSLALAPAASAETWTFRDADDVEHFTDDPASVPAAYRASLQRLGAGDEEGWYADLEERAEPTAAERRLEHARLSRGRARVARVQALLDEVDRLSRALLIARNEHRKWSVGGRRGAAERAAAAGREVRRLERELAVRQEEVARLQAEAALEAEAAPSGSDDGAEPAPGAASGGAESAPEDPDGTLGYDDR